MQINEKASHVLIFSQMSRVLHSISWKLVAIPVRPQNFSRPWPPRLNYNHYCIDAGTAQEGPIAANKDFLQHTDI